MALAQLSSAVNHESLQTQVSWKHQVAGGLVFPLLVSLSLPSESSSPLLREADPCFLLLLPLSFVRSIRQRYRVDALLRQLLQ